VAQRRHHVGGPCLGLSFLIAVALSATHGIADERGRGTEAPDLTPGAVTPTLVLDPVAARVARLEFRTVGVANLPLLQRRESQNDFLESHLMPRLSQQFERVPAIDFESSPEMIHTGLYDWETETAEYYAVKGARRAAREFLLEQPLFSPVMDFVNNLRGRGRGSLTLGGQGGQGGMRVGLHVSHGIPAVELRRPVGQGGQVRFRVGVLGSAGVEYTHQRVRNTELFAGFEASDQSYRLECRFSF